MSDRWLRLIRGVAALNLAATLLVSRNLWLTERDYPFTPVWPGLPQPPWPLDAVCLGAMLLALGMIVGGAVFKRLPLAWTRGTLGVVAAISAMWAVLDQSRWQPQVLLHLVLLIALPTTLKPGAQREWQLLTARLAMGFSYLYSGAQKLNHEFAVGLFPWLMQPLAGWFGIDLEQVPAPVTVTAALASAAAEAAAGALLFFPGASRLAAMFLIAMHGVILLALGPAGHAFNAVVWPWNVTMAVALWVLFIALHNDVRELSTAPPPSRWCRFATGSAVVFFGLLPALSFFGYWDAYLSFALYSGNTKEGRVLVHADDRERMPASARAAMNEEDAVSIYQWSMNAMGVTSYPADRVFLNIGQALARRATHGPVYVELADRPDAFSGRVAVRHLRLQPGGGPPVEASAEEAFDLTGWR